MRSVSICLSVCPCACVTFAVVWMLFRVVNSCHVLTLEKAAPINMFSPLHTQGWADTAANKLSVIECLNLLLSDSLPLPLSLSLSLSLPLLCLSDPQNKCLLTAIIPCSRYLSFVYHSIEAHSISANQRLQTVYNHGGLLRLPTGMPGTNTKSAFVWKWLLSHFLVAQNDTHTSQWSVNWHWILLTHN